VLERALPVQEWNSPASQAGGRDLSRQVQQGPVHCRAQGDTASLSRAPLFTLASHRLHPLLTDEAYCVGVRERGRRVEAPKGASTLCREGWRP
jgi:hypothetical protein